MCPYRQASNGENKYGKIEEVEEVNTGTTEDPKPVRVGKDPSTEIKQELVKLLIEKRSVFAYSYGDMPQIDPAIAQHELKVRDDVTPKVHRHGKMTPHLRDAVNAEVEKLRKVGFIREVQETTWLENIVPVGKPNGKERVCIDYSVLNEACPKDSFPLPLIEQLVTSTANHELMSMMDGYAGYNQIPLKEDDQEKTTFLTNLGVFCY